MSTAERSAIANNSTYYPFLQSVLSQSRLNSLSCLFPLTDFHGHLRSRPTDHPSSENFACAVYRQVRQNETTQRYLFLGFFFFFCSLLTSLVKYRLQQPIVFVFDWKLKYRTRSRSIYEKRSRIKPGPQRPSRTGFEIDSVGKRTLTNAKIYFTRI